MRKTFTSQHQVKEAVDKAILFYNMERPHSSLDRLTPEQAHGMQGEMKRHWHSWREEAIKKQNMMVVGNDDGCIVVNRKQSYRGRLTTESSSK